ncbi:exported hypothetical protein [Candidatus Sulfopaludibacter sp. SbA4]|nr:exported hypothetical protein [Candidatus Sulfopaludibacter sp. SbA4]
MAATRPHFQTAGSGWGAAAGAGAGSGAGGGGAASGSLRGPSRWTLGSRAGIWRSG